MWVSRQPMVVNGGGSGAGYAQSTRAQSSAWRVSSALAYSVRCPNMISSAVLSGVPYEAVPDTPVTVFAEECDLADSRANVHQVVARVERQHQLIEALGYLASARCELSIWPVTSVSASVRSSATSRH